MYDYTYIGDGGVLPLNNNRYVQVGDPVTTPIDIVDLKSQCRIDWTDGEQEAYLNLIIRTAVNRAENYMNRALVTRAFKTYRDQFEDVIEIRRPPFVALTSFKYVNSAGTIIDVGILPSETYYVTDNIYPQIILYPGKSWPTDIMVKKQAITIEFTSGYGVTKEAMPEDIRQALLIHCAYLYSNRGDSDLAASDPGGLQVGQSLGIPGAAKDIYDSYRIRMLTARTYY